MAWTSSRNPHEANETSRPITAASTSRTRYRLLRISEAGSTGGAETSLTDPHPKAQWRSRASSRSDDAHLCSGRHTRVATPNLRLAKGGTMWWGIGIGGGILYLIGAFTLGLMTLRNGHGWMFFFGIFFPVLWIFGAFMR